MIKKIFIPLIIILISVLIVINYLAYKSPEKSKIITQNNAYSITTNNDLNILIYANQKTAFQEEKAFDSVYLLDKEETKKLSIELLSIKALSSYKYLEENYIEYRYKFKMPELNSYFYIEEAYLFIRLKNGQEMAFKIGSFDYYLKAEDLNIIEYFGKRYEDFPTLQSITMKFSLDEEIFIEHVYLANSLFTYVGKTVTNNELITVNFPKLDKITDILTVKIDYQKADAFYTSTLPHFVFYETNENPLSYGVLNNVYLLD